MSPFIPVCRGMCQTECVFKPAQKGHWLEDILSTCVNSEMFDKSEVRSVYSGTRDNALFVLLNTTPSRELCQIVIFQNVAAAACDFITQFLLW